jgi:2-isopropylmalate synthase
LGKLSGRNAFRTRLKELGIELATEDLLNAAFAKFKTLADKKSEIFDEDLHALLNDEFISVDTEFFKLVYLQVASVTGEIPHAVITVSESGVEKTSESDGGGPVDAAFKAIENIAQSGAELLLYSVNNITSGTDAQGEVTVRLSKGGRIVNGQGADTDIVIASAKAYLNGLNKLHSKSEKMNPQV